MSDKMNKILDVSKMADGETKIVVWANTFKVKGKLYVDQSKLEEGILTLTDAIVCRHFDDCQCDETSHYYKWVNIFEEHVVAFSILH